MEVFAFCLNMRLQIRFHCLGENEPPYDCICYVHEAVQPLQAWKISKLTDILNLLQTNILIRIAERFYWAAASFYEEVSLA